MTIIDGFEDLQEYFSGLFFWKEFCFLDAVEELSAFAQLGYEIHIFIIFEVFVELEHIRVIQLLKNGYLHLEFFHVLNFLFRYRFTGPHQTELSMFAFSDNSKRTFSESDFVNLVDVFDFGIILLNHGGFANEEATSIFFCDDPFLLLFHLENKRSLNLLLNIKKIL